MIFVDTSAWFAACYAGDVHHPSVRKVLLGIGGEELVTTDHVLIETWSLINSRFGFARAEQFWSLLRPRSIRIEPAFMEDLRLAWAIAGLFPDQTFSIVDRTSFVVMQRLDLTRVISFDADFAIFRYGPQRNLAFEVLR